MRPRRSLSVLVRAIVPGALAALQILGAAALAQQGAPKAPARGPDDTAQVLVITGTDPFLPAFFAIDNAMRQSMAQKHRRPVVWMHESIDTARFGGAPGPQLAELLAKKYENVRVDAVVLVIEAAVDFYLQHRQRLWPAAPVVFHSVAPAYAKRLPAGARFSGVPSEVDFAGTVRIALALQPQARRALVVAGASPFDQMQTAAMREALAQFADRLDVEYLIGLTPGEVAARLARAAPETVVFYVTLFRDAHGHVHLPRAVLETLSAQSAVPIYGTFDTYLGHGVTAGAIDPFRHRGERVADLLVRALDGELASAPVIEPPTPSQCVADGRQLARHRLDARRLPAGCELRFVETGFFERYWWQSLVIVLALAAQTLLIVALLLQRKQRHAAELTLQAQRVQLLHASRLAVAGELTASIAHEINQPLGAILSNADAAELLIESGRMPRDELLQILADIKRDDLRASEVIRRLRALLARQEVEQRRIDLNRLVEATAAILGPEARRRAVTVEYALQAGRADVIGDPVQIQQVIINLVLNAFEASVDAAAQARRVRIETSDAAAGVQVSVRDFGAGIAPADLPRVFDSFFSTKRDGMGLGLAIARSIVEAHGGTIAAARCDVGAEFRVVLPAAGEPAGTTQAANA